MGFLHTHLSGSSTVASPVKTALCLVVLMVLLMPIGAVCPSSCVCKWKAGKATVECKSQGLTMVPDDLDPETQILDLSGNNLHQLPKHVFLNKSLINLQKIYLGNCKISQIHPSAFYQMPMLVELDLSDNLLMEVPSTAFLDTPYVHRLYLKGNQIRNLHNDSFLQTASLIRLDISYSGIRSIAPHAFQSLSSLKELYMQGNHLQVLPHPVVAKLGSIRILEVYDNNWMCDCNALPLWRLLEVQHIPHSISPVCAAPIRVKTRSFRSLVENDFTCSQEKLGSSHIAEISAGLVVIFLIIIVAGFRAHFSP